MLSFAKRIVVSKLDIYDPAISAAFFSEHCVVNTSAFGFVAGILISFTLTPFSSAQLLVPTP